MFLGNTTDVTVIPLLPGATASLSFAPGYPIVLADVRQWVRQLTDPSDEVELLVTELLSNAREHGSAGEIGVSLVCTEESTSVVVINTSLSAAPSAPSQPVEGDADQVRGRGLLIASSIADSLDIDQRGNQLTITARVTHH